MYKYECPECFGIIETEKKEKKLKCTWCDEIVNVTDDNLISKESDKKEEVKEVKEVKEKYSIDNYKSYDEGQYYVGSDISSGDYLVWAKNYSNAYFSISNDANGNDIVSNLASFTQCYIHVEDKEFVEIQRAKLYNVKECNLEQYSWVSNKTDTGIMLRVGIDLDEGTYKIKTTSSNNGYFAIYDGPLGREENIIDNDIFTGSRYITVENGQYLLFSAGTDFERGNN